MSKLKSSFHNVYDYTVSSVGYCGTLNPSIFDGRSWPVSFP